MAMKNAAGQRAGFSDDQLRQLRDKLDASLVKTLEGKPYIPGWVAIDAANRIFGHDGWSYEVTELRCVEDRDYTYTDRSNREVETHRCTYVARVRLTVIAGERELVREDVGCHSAQVRDVGQCHEAGKSAVTDGLKRALRSLGYPLGLALYDRDGEHVGVSETLAAAKADDAERQASARASLVEEVKGKIGAARSPQELARVMGAQKARVDAAGLDQSERDQLNAAYQAKTKELTEATAARSTRAAELAGRTSASAAPAKSNGQAAPTAA